MPEERWIALASLASSPVVVRFERSRFQRARMSLNSNVAVKRPHISGKSSVAFVKRQGRLSIQDLHNSRPCSLSMSCRDLPLKELKLGPIYEQTTPKMFRKCVAGFQYPVQSSGQLLFIICLYLFLDRSAPGCGYYSQAT
jgi:hypothetical protein